MATKQKKDNAEQNGRIQELTPEVAQQVVDATKRAKAERFQVEYQRLCAEYGLEIAGRPMYSDDGHTIVMLFVREIPK